MEEFAPICEVQSDKASVVITSRYKGKISQILFMPGDVVKVSGYSTLAYIHYQRFE